MVMRSQDPASNVEHMLDEISNEIDSAQNLMSYRYDDILAEVTDLQEDRDSLRTELETFKSDFMGVDRNNFIRTMQDAIKVLQSQIDRWRLDEESEANANIEIESPDNSS